MKDLIFRQDAIDAVSDCGICIQRIVDLPSVQPNSPDNLVKDSQGLAKELVNDCISRQEAIDEVINLWADKPFGNPALVEIKECIEKLPSVHPERKHGKWIDYTEDGYVECPFCHSATNCDGNKDELHFCFSCGADMRGEQDE